MDVVLVCKEGVWTLDSFGALSCSGTLDQIDVTAVTQPLAWSVSSIPPEDLAGAFGAGFIVMGTGMAIAWAIAFVVRAIRSL